MWTASARAKINLHLAVHARRPDGYHALTTVFQTIALADTLTIVEHDGPFTLRCPGSDAPEDGTNLVVRAARALAEELGRPEPAGLAVTLDKQVPTQAGLGGGSADAMAALRLLCAVWRVPPDRDLLARVGRRLGSDVPFFAWGGTALGPRPRRRDHRAAAVARAGLRDRASAVRRAHGRGLPLGGRVSARAAPPPGTPVRPAGAQRGVAGAAAGRAGTTSSRSSRRGIRRSPRPSPRCATPAPCWR